MSNDSSPESNLELAEFERIWMSHELHDGVLQWIVGAKMQAEALHAQSVDGSSPSTDQLKYLVEILSKAVLDGRRLLVGLRPPELDESDWHVALAHWVAIAGTGRSSMLALKLDENTRNMSELRQRCAYRIVQEAVGNALRHAEASHIEVTAQISGDNFLLSIKDDGRGFDPAGVVADRYGLKGIQERAELMSGSAKIESTPGNGTSVEVQFPSSLSI